MNAFGVDDKHAVRIDHNPRSFEYLLRQSGFVLLFDVNKLLNEFFVVRKIADLFQQVQIGNPILADFARNEVGKCRVGMQQPAARRYAVGNIGKFFRP